jgi:anti-sigma regulatory factor (Ser/Thr protein kinase)
MSEDHAAVLECSLEAFRRHATEVSAFLELHAVEPRAVYNLELAFEELVTNIIKYAHDDSSGHTIRYVVRIDDDQVGLEVEDDGRPFDPVSAALPQIATKLEEADIGGLGLHVLRRTSREFSYTRNGDRNHIEITFPRS